MGVDVQVGFHTEDLGVADIGTIDPAAEIQDDKKWQYASTDQP